MRAMIRTLVASSLTCCLVLFGSLLTTGCSRGNEEAKPVAAGSAQPTTADPATPADGVDAPPPPPAYVSALPASVSERLNQPFTGDLDEMVKRRLVRVGVTFNRTHCFVDQGVQRGMAYE